MNAHRFGRAATRGPLQLALMVMLVLPAARPVAAQSHPEAQRIVSIGGALTEIVYALGEEHRLVARDTTSSYPSVAEDLPDVGYMRRLSPEGILSVNPDMILAMEGSGPPETLDVMERAAIPFVTIAEGFDAASVVAKIRAVGHAIGAEEKAEALAAEVEADLAAVQSASGGQDSPKRVLFILSNQGGRLMASGSGTAADGVIRMAGAQNAVTEFEGYKILTDEAVSRAAPDVILMMDREDNHAAADADLIAHPGLAASPAAQNGAILRMNGLLLLGFGPRTGQAVRDLHAALYAGG